jgi:hypothetical protein
LRPILAARGCRFQLSQRFFRAVKTGPRFCQASDGDQVQHQKTGSSVQSSLILAQVIFEKPNVNFKPFFFCAGLESLRGSSPRRFRSRPGLKKRRASEHCVRCAAAGCENPSPAADLLLVAVTSTRGLQSSRCKAVDSVLNHPWPTIPGREGETMVLRASFGRRAFQSSELPEAVAPAASGARRAVRAQSLPCAALQAPSLSLGRPSAARRCPTPRFPGVKGGETSGRRGFRRAARDSLRFDSWSRWRPLP